MVYCFPEPIYKAICNLVGMLSALKFHYFTPDVCLFNGVVFRWCVWDLFFWRIFGGCSTTLGRFWGPLTAILWGLGSWTWRWRLWWQGVVGLIIQPVNQGTNSGIRDRPKASKLRMWRGPEFSNSIRVLIIFEKKVKILTVSEAFRKNLRVSEVFYAVSE